MSLTRGYFTSTLRWPILAQDGEVDVPFISLFFFLIFFFLFFFIAFLSSRLGTNYVLRNFLQLEAPTVEVEERMMVKSTDRRAVHALYDSAKVRPGTNRKARARQGWPFSHT